MFVISCSLRQLAVLRQPPGAVSFMSDFILARVSQTLATERTLETLVRQLLEMLELVTRMESTYLTRIDLEAQRQLVMYAHNSSEMQIPEGFSVPWDESLCKRAIDDNCIFCNEVGQRWRSCTAAQELDRHVL